MNVSIHICVCMYVFFAYLCICDQSVLNTESKTNVLYLQPVPLLFFFWVVKFLGREQKWKKGVKSIGCRGRRLFYPHTHTHPFNGDNGGGVGNGYTVCSFLFFLGQSFGRPSVKDYKNNNYSNNSYDKYISPPQTITKIPVGSSKYYLQTISHLFISFSSVWVFCFRLV